MLEDCYFSEDKMSERPSRKNLETRLDRAVEQEDLAIYMSDKYPEGSDPEFVRGWEAAWEARLWMLSGLIGGLLVALGREGETR